MATPALPAPPARFQRSLLTWISSLANSLLLAALGFLTTPLLLRWLGRPAWGAWEVIGEWLGYLGLAHLALGPGAIAVFLLRARTTGSDVDFVATAKRGWLWYWRATLAATPLAVALVWWAPHWLRIGASAAPVVCALFLACAGAMLFAPPQLFRSVLEAVQRGYQVRWALLAQSLTITSASLIFAFALRHGPWGITGMALAQLLGLAVGAMLWLACSRRWLRGWRAIRPAALSGSALWAINWPLAVAGFGNQINVLTDSSVVAWRLGAAAVAPLVLTQTVVLLAGGQMAEVGSVSWAALGELRASAPEAFRSRVVELAATMVGVCAVLVATVACFDRDFVRLWVGDANFGGNRLLLFTVAGSVIFSLISFFGWLIDTQGDTRRRIWVSSLGSILNLALSILLAPRLGIAGVALATAIAYTATDAWFLPWIAIRHYGIAASGLVRALLGAGVRGGLWGAALAFCARAWAPAANWMQLLLRFALAGGLALVYCWWVVLRSPDRAAWRARWQGLRSQ